MQQSAEMSETVRNLVDALPGVQKREVIEERLEAMSVERRGLEGYLPKAELAAAISGGFRDISEAFGRERRGFERMSIFDTIRQVSNHGPEGIRIRDYRHAFELLVWVLGPAIEPMLEASVARLDYREGASRETREQAARALDTERAQLVAEHERLVDQARAAGLEAVHLPETATRRRAEAAQREREEKVRRQQEEAAAEANRKHADAEHAAEKSQRRTRLVTVGAESRTRDASLYRKFR